MATEFTGTLTEDGIGGPVSLERNEKLSIALNVGAAENAALVRVERSVTNQQTWETATGDDGTVLSFDGADTPLVGDLFVGTLLNATAGRMWVRVVVTAFDGDDIIIALAQVAGDALEVVLRDSNGRALISVRDDGGLIIHGILAGDNEDGNLEVEGGVTGEYVATNEDEDGITIVAQGEGWTEYVKNLTISAADIVETAAGGFAHASGYPLVADPGTGLVVELVSAFVRNDRAVAAYTDGGNTTINRNGGAAITGLVSAANFLGNAADTRSMFVPLAAAAEVMAANKGLNLVTSAAFTQPGTAAGVVEVRIRYRVHEDTL